MTIIEDAKFISNLKDILAFISKDGKEKARRFNYELHKKISNIPVSPYKYRKSYYFEDTSVRDMIFKGYTILYLIDEDKDVIVILEIFKWIDR